MYGCDLELWDISHCIDRKNPVGNRKYIYSLQFKDMQWFWHAYR
jgi:hypothetical protein